MLKPEQVPKECREAFYQAYWRSGLPSHAALAAAINAWPGLWMHPYTKNFTLPMPQEPRDDPQKT